MSDLVPHRYLTDGLAAGRDREVMEAAQRNLSSLNAKGLTPILSLGHLSHLTGAPYRDLRAIIERIADPYVDITRPKRSGGIRHLSSPLPLLLGVQRWVLDNVLKQVKMHSASFAYQRNRSTVQCAQRHVGASWLIKVDLHDFFPRISEQQVFRVFRLLGYPPLVSFELARLCTRARPFPKTKPTNRYSTIPTYANRQPGELPQGAPTSGALANAVATGLDGRLDQFSRENGLVYTRYSDDLTFSSSAEFHRSLVAKTIPRIEELVHNSGFLVHKKKTRLVPPGSRQVVLGLLVTQDAVRLLPEFRRRIETHVRGVSHFGLSQHAAHRGFDSIIGLVNHIDGLIAYAIGIEARFGREVQVRWNRTLAVRGGGVFTS